MAVATFTVHAGDFEKRDGHEIRDGALLMHTPGRFLREKIAGTDIASVEIASQETVQQAGGSLGGAIVGAALFGVVGAAVGAMAGSGPQKRATFVCKLKDGRAFLATGSPDVLLAFQAATFREGLGTGVAPPSGRGNIVVAIVLLMILVTVCITSFGRTRPSPQTTTPALSVEAGGVPIDASQTDGSPRTGRQRRHR